MTFDEARRYLIGHFENMNLEEIISILSRLREEYAPTIEMTQSQVDELNSFKSNFTSNQLVYVPSNEQNPWCFLEELSSNLWGHRQHAATDKNIEDTMQVYLHPETVKVIDEKI